MARVPLKTFSCTMNSFSFCGLFLGNWFCIKINSNCCLKYKYTSVAHILTLIINAKGITIWRYFLLSDPEIYTCYSSVKNVHKLLLVLNYFLRLLGSIAFPISSLSGNFDFFPVALSSTIVLLVFTQNPIFLIVLNTDSSAPSEFLLWLFSTFPEPCFIYCPLFPLLYHIRKRAIF